MMFARKPTVSSCTRIGANVKYFMIGLEKKNDPCLNVSKSLFLMFQMQSSAFVGTHVLSVMVLIINNNHNHKFLGMSIDNKLAWQAHCTKFRLPLSSIRFQIRCIKKSYM